MTFNWAPYSALVLCILRAASNTVPITHLLVQSIRGSRICHLWRYQVLAEDHVGLELHDY